MIHPVPGLEARHRWSGPLEIVFNDLLSGYPRYEVKTIGGWRSTADVTLVTEANTGKEGERSRFTSRVGKTLTYEGLTQARSMVELRTLEDELMGAFWDPSNEYEMTVEIRADNAWVPLYTYKARAMSIDGPETQAASPMRETAGFERSFIVTLRMGDARLHSVGERVLSTGPIGESDFGIIPPVTPPILWDPYPSASSVSILTDSTAPVDPVITIYGPITGPVIHNDTLGRHLEFPSVVLGNSDFLVVNFATRQVLLGGTSDYSKFLKGDWWDRGVPGLAPFVSNTVRIAGSVIDDPARAMITYKPTRY